MILSDKIYDTRPVSKRDKPVEYWNITNLLDPKEIRYLIHRSAGMTNTKSSSARILASSSKSTKHLNFPKLIKT